VHSHSDHLTALLKAAKEFGLYKVVIHPFLDGRDTPPQSTADYMEGLENTLVELGIGFIGTVSGRYYAMDRDHNSEH
jgi:2,3-bisphosphoglycerate-independent phosphoglycerate mutase